jgi:O-antigen/teichoic acid export membrane protein
MSENGRSGVPVPRSSVGRQAIFLAGATGIAQVAMAVIYLLAARESGPSEFGLVVAAIAVGSTAVGFVDFGTNSHWAREIARGNMEPRELGHRVTTKVFVALLLSLGWSVSMAVLFPHSGLWIAGPVLMAQLLNQTSQVSLRGTARGELVALTILIDRAVAIVTFFGVCFLGGKATDGLWIAIVAGSLSAAVAGHIATERARRPIAALPLIINPWRGAGYFGITQLANSAQSLDLPLLTFVGGPLAGGLLGAVSRWTQPMGLLASAFSSAAAPFVAGTEDILGAWEHLRKGIWMPACAIVLSLSIFAFAPLIVPLLLGNAYQGSVNVLRVLALVSIPSIISQPAMVALQSLGMDRYVARVMTSAIVLQLALVVILGAAYGALGAAFASLIVQCGILAMFAHVISNEVRRVVKAKK